MKKNSFLVKTVLMSMLTAVSISFASCSDDDDLMTNPYTTDDSEVAMTRGGSASDAFKPNVDHSQWMAQLNNSRLVADLSLPGTHDACTGEGWHLASQIGMSAATTQDLTIDEQLKVGVRVFDLRPERVLSTTDATYDLRCCHGIMQTELLVKDFFIKMRDFLRENPTEFCIVTSNVTDTPDMNAWAEQFAALVNDSEFSGLFADFAPRLTVGEMRGHVLLLSRDACNGMTAGGFLKGWSSSKHFNEQQNGTIKGTLTLGLQSARFTFSDYQEYEGVYYSRIIASTSDWRNQEQHEKNFSSFLQVKHRWGPVIANVGVRYDHVKRRTGKTNNELSPRMALIFMQPRWGSKLCYSTSFVDRAFKHRCITESYTDPESASPEYSRCWQLTLWGKQLLKGLNAEVTLYHSTAENMVETIAGSDEGMMKSIGMEICADYTLGKLGVHGNASWKRMLEHKAYFEAEEDEIELSDPKFSANTTVSYQLLPTLRLHVNAHYIGRRYLKPQSYPYLY